MGNGSSLDVQRTVYLDINGKIEKIIFSRHCSSKDIHDLICTAAGASSLSQVTLKSKEGAHVPLAPTMPLNVQQQPYIVNIIKKPEEQSEANVLHSVLSRVSDQFNRAFKVEEMRCEMEQRLNVLEKKLQNENMKTIEIEKCKKDITDLRDQMWQQQKSLVQSNERISRRTSLHQADENIENSLKYVRSQKIPNFQKYTLSQETIEYVRRPTFDIWHWEPNEMLSLLEHFYVELELVQEFNINPITLKRWLLCIQVNYRNNPFHNFRHCFCVSQMMYGMIHECKLWEKMPREDLGILITAAICHDLDHPGYNNTYQINARTELAIRYNDISPLENHHCACAFQILNNPETNIFANVDKETFARIRKGMTMLILATDMARHGEIIENFKHRIEEGFDFKKKEHGDTLKMVLIKCCDISNEVRPMAVSEPWLDCLLEEYFNQSDREKQEGLPVAPFMDRDKVTKPTAQIGFIKFVLMPMFQSVAKLFTHLDKVMVQPLQGSLAHYEQLKSLQDTQESTNNNNNNNNEKDKDKNNKKEPAKDSK